MMMFFVYALTAVLVVCCLLLIGVVLLQRPRSEGLGSAFGGGMTESMFGAGTTDVLSKFTIWMAGAFFVLTILLAMLMSHGEKTSGSVFDETLATEETSAVEEKGASVTPESTEAPGEETNDSSSSDHPADAESAGAQSESGTASSPESPAATSENSPSPKPSSP